MSEPLKVGDKVRLIERPEMVSKVRYVDDLTVVIRWKLAKGWLHCAYPAKNVWMFVERAT